MICCKKSPRPHSETVYPFVVRCAKFLSIIPSKHDQVRLASCPEVPAVCRRIKDFANLRLVEACAQPYVDSVLSAVRILCVASLVCLRGENVVPQVLGELHGDSG